MDDICGTHTKPYATKQEINFVYPLGYNILQSDTVSILKRKAVCTIPYKVHIAILERRMNGCAVMLATQSSCHLPCLYSVFRPSQTSSLANTYKAVNAGKWFVMGRHLLLYFFGVCVFEAEGSSSPASPAPSTISASLTVFA